jgi:hypothetical protein
MPLKKGFTQKTVSHNIKEMMKAGHAPKQAVAASLANARKYKKMASGGLAESTSPPSPQPPLIVAPHPIGPDEGRARKQMASAFSEGGEMGYPGLKPPKGPKKSNMFSNGGRVGSDDQDAPMNYVGSIPGKGRKEPQAFSDGGQAVWDGGMGDIPPETEGPSDGVEDKHTKHNQGFIEGEYEDDSENPGEDSVVGGGLDKNESMAEMHDLGPDSQLRSLNEIREDGEYYPSEVENPDKEQEDAGFAAALRRQAEGVMNQRDYAMGGLVQDGPEGDEPVGNMPSEGDVELGDTQMASTDMEDATPHTKKPNGLEHRIMGNPTGPELSEEALEAIRLKKKSRRYGSYSPSGR